MNLRHIYNPLPLKSGGRHLPEIKRFPCLVKPKGWKLEDLFRFFLRAVATTFKEGNTRWHYLHPLIPRYPQTEGNRVFL